MAGSGRAAVIAALFFCIMALRVDAQDVTLTSHDSRVEITGTLMGFDGEFYRVQTDYGELTVDGSGVFCEGPGCPDLQDFVAELELSGSATMGDVLMPALLQAYAQRAGFDAVREQEDSTRFTYILSRSDTGKVAARFRFRVGSVFVPVKQAWGI